MQNVLKSYQNVFSRTIESTVTEMIKLKMGLDEEWLYHSIMVLLNDIWNLQEVLSVGDRHKIITHNP